MDDHKVHNSEAREPLRSSEEPEVQASAGADAEDSAAGHASLFRGWDTAANRVTMARIVLVIVFLVFLCHGGVDGSRSIAARWWAFATFVVAAATDKLDGYLARKNHEVTEIGKLLDPIADKLLICGALVVLAAFGELNPLGWLIAALFLIREIGITVMRLFVIDTGGKVIAANKAGKLKTLFECIGLGMLIFPMWSFFAPHATFVTVYYWIVYAVIIVALALCLYSGAVYVNGVLVARRLDGRRGNDLA